MKTTTKMNNITDSSIGQTLYNTTENFTAMGWQCATDNQMLSLTNNFWSQNGIVLGVSGRSSGIYNGRNFSVSSNGRIESTTLRGTGTRMVVAKTNGTLFAEDIPTDDQTASEVDSNTPVDVDGDGNTETAVENVIQSMASITSKAARIFYPPPLNINTSVNGLFAINLYSRYANQYGTPQITSLGSPATIPTYGNTDLYYYVTSFNPAVFANITISAQGIMNYDIIGQPINANDTLINIVFAVK